MRFFLIVGPSLAAAVWLRDFKHADPTRQTRLVFFSAYRSISHG